METQDKEEVTKEITAKFAGKWKQIRCENIEAFFIEMGLNFFLRKLALQANPEVDIAINGVDIQISFKTPMKAECMKYKLNEEVEVETQKGKFNATTTYVNGKLISKQVPIPGNEAKPMVTEREVNKDGELETTMHVGKVTCKRIFTKLS